ncbi:MAG: hypothetical protein KME43_18945 [Myxacorys chilensis ATA2-1-KO14]|nr:hypothetical protein [Myxacorys chilensis ATA2-1-KO14]
MVNLLALVFAWQQAFGMHHIKDKVASPEGRGAANLGVCQIQIEAWG